MDKIYFLLNLEFVSFWQSFCSVGGNNWIQPESRWHFQIQKEDFSCCQICFVFFPPSSFWSEWYIYCEFFSVFMNSASLQKNHVWEFSCYISVLEHTTRELEEKTNLSFTLLEYIYTLIILKGDRTNTK